ncbi:ral GTPase-activating protein subunit alpha-2 isoform X2 [Oratosquilla oratoria]|uniref:ral GTPase-activating protein subunit alpha-2 isoform X2 n=1 Tax=Oratosquilla oratoria TaxID=337810 RepID=UPI003F758332
MFKKNTNSSDVKKSQSKCLDVKKDTPIRLKHLRTVLDNADIGEIKPFLEVNYSPVFFVFYDAFITTECNLKQKGTFAVQRSHKEDLECALYVLDRLLCLLPDLFARRWQCNALTHIFKKILHPGNTIRMRREAMRLFVLWYLIVGEGKTAEMDRMFASLIPGFPVAPMGASDFGQLGISYVEASPILPPSSAEKTPDDLTSYLLRSLLDFMVTQVRRVEWRDKAQHPKSFAFLFSSFRTAYLPFIFPNFSSSNSLYKPNLELPELRTSPGVSMYGTCQVAVIEWVCKFVMASAQRRVDGQSSSNIPGDDDGRRSGHGDAPEGSASDQDSVTSAFYVNEDYAQGEDGLMVRDILFSARDNINFVHELFRQALCLSFRYCGAMKAVIVCYKDWIQMNVPEMPPFMLEPMESSSPRDDYTSGSGAESDSSSSSSRRLRNDSYLGAVHKDIHIRAGLQNVLQVFVTSAANVFLLEVSPDYPRLLDEQVELCKLVLNIYRYMVMNTRMEQKTWEQLLIVLLHVTSQTLNGRPTRHKEDSLGGRFASALFQTLIVSWIKANLSVVISSELWDQLLLTLSSLTHWDELIKEWAKTLDTLTRVLARHVYGLELNNLPLERVNERKAIKRGNKMTGLDSSRNSFARSWSSIRMERQGTPVHTVSGDSSSVSNGMVSSNATVPPSSLSNLQEESHAHQDPQQDRSPYSRKRRGSSSGSSSLKASGGGSGSPKLSPHHSNHQNHHTHGAECLHDHIGPQRGISRSLSESSLAVKREMLKTSEHDGCLNHNHHRLRSTMSKSLEILSHHDDDSRTPSPAPSSGVESSSMKDSPMQIDLGGDTASIDTLEGGLSSDQRSVMSGGTVRGWLPDVAVVLWRRVLGLLGDPNDVASPLIHAQIFKYLADLTETLVKLRNNQSITVDNQSSPEPPELIPPVSLVASWCFRALSLPPQYHRGKTLAYRLMCVMMVRRHDVAPNRDSLTHFYRVLHQGLVGTDQEIINTLVGECGPNFFSLGLPGASMLTLDFIFATNTVLTSPDTKASPRCEALSVLGSLLPLSALYPSMPVLQPSHSDLSLMNCADVKDHLIHVLLKCGKRETWWHTRSLALCTLSVYLYMELAHHTFHSKCSEAISVLLSSLRLPSPSLHGPKSQHHHSLEVGRLVGQIAADMLLLLSDHAETLLSHYSELPTKIIQVLCQTLGTINSDPSLSAGVEGQHLALSVLFCLAEWVMKMPQHVLMQPVMDKQPLIHHVFKVLNPVASGTKTVMTKSPSVEVPDFDPNVREDISRSETASKSDTLKRRSFANTCASTLRLAARAVTSHIVNHLWHFPLGVGAQRLSSLVVEGDDVPGLVGDELSSEVFMSPHIQLFAMNQSCLFSLVQLPALQVPGGAATAGFKTPNSEVRLIMRDLSGKFSWDASLLYSPPMDLPHDPNLDVPPPHTAASHFGAGIAFQGFGQHMGMGPLVGAAGGLGGSRDDVMSSSILVTSPPRHTLRHRLPGVLPTHEDSADDLDNLDDLLSYVGHTSPEVLEQFGRALNESTGPPLALPIEAEHDTITTILNQRNMETDFLARHTCDTNMISPHVQCPSPVEPRSVYQQCRLLFDQLGFASWEKRNSIYTLKKNDKLLRELKNLDNQKCRETHKVAVIYIAEGQEDKLSILSNSGGSEGFEEFVGGLGWEVELATHTGFMGGLQRNGSTGETAPYFATSLTEVVYHVSTRMPSHTEQSMLQKTRHLGNDEVHIVWSEHTRDYRRGIIPTEFCDVLIVIYPIPNMLYRIQISTKPDVPLFGPLFDGAIVTHKVLPGLVRTTAINASRSKRSRLALYQNFYEERARALDTIIEQYSEATTYESFISSVYCPVFPQPFPAGPSRASGTSFSSRMYDVGGGASGGGSALAAALLDGPATPTPHPHLVSRPTSYSTGEQHHLREKARHILMPDAFTDHSTSNSSVSSPRGNKKLSFKSSRKVSSNVHGVSLAPPTQPTPVSSTASPGGPTPSYSHTQHSSCHPQSTPPESPLPPPRKPKDGGGTAAALPARNK